MSIYEHIRVGWCTFESTWAPYGSAGLWLGGQRPAFAAGAPVPHHAGSAGRACIACVGVGCAPAARTIKENKVMAKNADLMYVAISSNW